MNDVVDLGEIEVPEEPDFVYDLGREDLIRLVEELAQDKRNSPMSRLNSIKLLMLESAAPDNEKAQRLSLDMQLKIAEQVYEADEEETDVSED